MSARRRFSPAEAAAREAAFARLLSEDRRRRRAGTPVERMLCLLPRRLHDAALLDRASRLATALRRTRLLDLDCAWSDARRLTARFAFGVAQLLAAGGSWIRAPEAWSPRTRNDHRQFSSLSRHLLCAYDVPTFMDQAWFDPVRARRRAHQRWFILMGQGRNIRAADDLPAPLSRRAAHLFTTEVPDAFTVRAGFRYAQWRALGADRRLVDALLASRMAEDFVHDDFWTTVVRFLVDHPMLDRDLVGPIVDFIDHRRHGADGIEPEQPNFAMAGRSPTSLLRQVDEWHQRLHRGRLSGAALRWPSSGVRGHVRVEGRGESAVRYQIREILDSASLTAEGREMRHCVGSYARSCARGQVAVFTMRAVRKNEISERLTIAVLPAARRVVEARGPRNARATRNQARVVQGWAQECGLEIGDGSLA